MCGYEYEMEMTQVHTEAMSLAVLDGSASNVPGTSDARRSPAACPLMGMLPTLCSHRTQSAALPPSLAIGNSSLGRHAGCAIALFSTPKAAKEPAPDRQTVQPYLCTPNRTHRFHHATHVIRAAVRCSTYARFVLAGRHGPSGLRMEPVRPKSGSCPPPRAPRAPSALSRADSSSAQPPRAEEGLPLRPPSFANSIWLFRFLLRHSRSGHFVAAHRRGSCGPGWVWV